MLIFLETKGPGILEARLLSEKSAIVKRTETAILSYYIHMANTTLKMERKNQEEDLLENKRVELEKSFKKKQMR